MRRYTTQDLQDWITDSRRKPLIVRGARQVGKTCLVRKLSEIKRKQFI